MARVPTVPGVPTASGASGRLSRSLGERRRPAVRRAGRAPPRPPSLPGGRRRAAVRPRVRIGAAHGRRRRVERVGRTSRRIRAGRRGGHGAVGEHRPAPGVERLHALVRAPHPIGPRGVGRVHGRAGRHRGAIFRSIDSRGWNRSAALGVCPAPKSPADARSTGVHRAAPGRKNPSDTTRTARRRPSRQMGQPRPAFQGVISND